MSKAGPTKLNKCGPARCIVVKENATNFAIILRNNRLAYSSYRKASQKTVHFMKKNSGDWD